MTPAKRRLLERLRDKLLQAALHDLDPAVFPGVGKAPAELTKQERGDKVWHLKAARAELAAVKDIEEVLGVDRRALAAMDQELPVLSNADIAKLIRNAEADVQRIRERSGAETRDKEGQ